MTERRDGTLQVGLHADRSLALPDEPGVRAMLARLRHHLDPTTLTDADFQLFTEITTLDESAAGLERCLASGGFPGLLRRLVA